MQLQVSNNGNTLQTRVTEGLAETFNRSRLIFMAVFSIILTYLLSASSTFAQSDTIEIDMAPFFTNMNTYIPIFFGIFAIVGGIMAAMALSKLIINAVVSALSGRGSF